MVHLVQTGTGRVSAPFHDWVHHLLLFRINLLLHSSRLRDGVVQRCETLPSIWKESKRHQEIAHRLGLRERPLGG